MNDDKKNWPQWLKNADTQDADVSVDSCGYVTWLGGEWLRGEWRGGEWRGGVWRGGEWRGGVWLRGEWLGGEWHGGEWHGGEWRGGVWRGGEWLRGEWLGGVWRGGVWRGEENRLLYMAAQLGIVFGPDGKASAYRTTTAKNRGHYNKCFVQTPGRVEVQHELAGAGTCVAGLHVTTASRAWTYFGIDPTAKLWRVTFERDDLLDCDGEKARLRGGWCEEIPWPFLEVKP